MILIKSEQLLVLKRCCHWTDHNIECLLHDVSFTTAHQIHPQSQFSNLEWDELGTVQLYVSFESNGSDVSHPLQ